MAIPVPRRLATWIVDDDPEEERFRTAESVEKFWKYHFVEMPRVNVNQLFLPINDTAVETLFIGFIGGNLPDKPRPRLHDLRTFELLCPRLKTQRLFEHDAENITQETFGGFFQNRFLMLSRSLETENHQLITINPQHGITDQCDLKIRLEEDQSIIFDEHAFWSFGGAWETHKNPITREFPLKEAWLYFLGEGDTWPVPDMEEARRRPGVAVLQNGHLLICGGFQGVKPNETLTVLKSVVEYCPRRHVYSRRPPMLYPRTNFPLVEVDGCAVAIAGYAEAGPLRWCEGFVSMDKGWEEMPALNVERHGHSAVVLEGSIYVVGGVSSGNRPVPHIEVLRPNARKWRVMGNFLQPRYCGVVAVFRAWLTPPTEYEREAERGKKRTISKITDDSAIPSTSGPVDSSSDDGNDQHYEKSDMPFPSLFKSPPISASSVLFGAKPDPDGQDIKPEINNDAETEVAIKTEDDNSASGNHELQKIAEGDSRLGDAKMVTTIAQERVGTKAQEPIKLPRQGIFITDEFGNFDDLTTDEIDLMYMFDRKNNTKNWKCKCPGDIKLPRGWELTQDFWKEHTE